MPLSNTCILLLQEANLAQGTLALGLTSLRKAQHPDKAEFYSGFFNVSIALERILKLILVVDHMRHNKFVPPSKAELKARGHDIVSLYETSVHIGSRLGVQGYGIPAPRSIEAKILLFLSEFARVSRYYNLDALLIQPQGYADPLARWDSILSEVLNTDVPKQQLRKRLAQAQAIHDLFAGSAVGLQHGMDGRQLEFHEFFTEPAKHELAAPYALVRLFNLLNPTIVTVGEVGRQGFSENLLFDRRIQHVPLLHEFFSKFRLSPIQIRRKRRWP